MAFKWNGSSWQSDADVSDKLERLVDAGGNTIGWRLTLAAGDGIETYDSSGRLATRSDRAGLTQTLTYSDGTAIPPNGQTHEGTSSPLPAGLLIRVTDHFGRSISLGYDTSHRVVRLTDPAAANYIYTYNAESSFASVTYPDDKARTYHYNEPEHTGGENLPLALTGITDENNDRFATFKYDASGRAVSTERAGGAEHYTFAYNPDGTTTLIDPLGTSRTLTYESLLGFRRLVTITGPACPHCGPLSRTHDPNGNVASNVDWNGNRICYKHDAVRNLEIARAEGLTGSCPADLSTWMPASDTEQRKISTEWHPTWRLPTRIAEPKRITTYVYGEPTDRNPGNRGSVLAKTVQATNDTSGAQGFSATPIGTPRTWTYTYNANGQVLAMDGPRTDATDVTTYTYHPNDDPDPGKRGNLATITNPLGHATQFSAYNAHGQPLTIVDPNGLTSTLIYDARQRLTSRIVGTETTSYEYDGVGQLTTVTRLDGSFLSYDYDPAHRLTDIRDNLGNHIKYTLDLMGNRRVEEVYDPLGTLNASHTREYNALNRLFRDIGGTNPATQVTQYGYDDQGNLKTIDGPLTGSPNDFTQLGYDALNRLKQVTDALSGVTQYRYDGLDQLVSVTDPRNNATTYTLDGLGNLTAQSSPDAGATTNTPDAAGNVVSSTDAKGQTTSYTYDALNRVTQIVYNQATGTQLKQIDYGYDQGPNAIGRLSSITEASAAGAVLQTTTYGYDQQGRIASETRAIGGQTYITTYAYQAGRMTGMTYPSGRTVSYGFDGAGRINRLETTGGGETRVVVQDVVYHPFGGPKAFTFGNLQAYSRSFDLDGRIATHTLAGETKVLTFDAASRIRRIESQGAPTNFADFGYDALDRLTSTVLPTSSFGYDYDPSGNRLSKNTGGSIDTYTYSPTSNRLASIAGSSGARAYAHDASGSITSDGLNTYSYDARGRLVSAVSSVGTTSYQVNALGQRVRKSSSLGDTVYHYDAQGRLIAESSPAGTPVREYLWLADQPVAVAAAQSLPGTGCPATPQLDTSNTFRPFPALEGLEAHSGRPGARGWEWRIGTNVRRPKTSDEADLDWVSGKPYAFRLTYDGAGNASVTVRDGGTVLFTLSQTGGMDVGNALRFQVRSAAGIKAGNLIQASITSIDGQAVAERLETAGDGSFSELARVFAGESLKNGFTVEGTVSLTFTGSYPPRGSRLRFLVTGGDVTCQAPTPAAKATLYYVLTDHLNTPRAIADEQHRVVWRWESQEPFGKSPPEENPSGLGTFEFALRFPGQYFDRETNVAYNYFRDYDPQTGRYVQSDPIGLAGGLNTYLYVRGNPISRRDPRGLYDGLEGEFLPGTDPFPSATPGDAPSPPMIGGPREIEYGFSTAVGLIEKSQLLYGTALGLAGGPRAIQLVCRAAVIVKDPCKNPIIAAALGTAICTGNPPNQFLTDLLRRQEISRGAELSGQGKIGVQGQRP